jgi:hypothetical protein
MNLEKIVGKTRIVPFKDCRLSKEDDRGYCAKIAVHPNWTKEGDLKKFDKKDISLFNHFNLKTLEANVTDAGGIESFRGQIYSLYIDDNYLYPLSPFDSVYLDMDTEYQIQLFKNREIREGFSDKIILRRSVCSDPKDEQDTVEKIKSWMGPDGGKILLFEDEFDENGEVLKSGGFAVDQIKTNINDKLFESWEKSLSNNIRKSAKGMPAILIDYEMGTLGAASGEMIKQAVEYYNSITEPTRQALSEMLKEIYKNHENEILKSNDIWNLKEVSLLKEQSKPLNYVATPPI